MSDVKAAPPASEPNAEPAARPKPDRAAIVLVALCVAFLLVTFFVYAGR